MSLKNIINRAFVAGAAIAIAANLSGTPKSDQLTQRIDAFYADQSKESGDCTDSKVFQEDVDLFAFAIDNYIFKNELETLNKSNLLDTINSNLKEIITTELSTYVRKSKTGATVSKFHYCFNPLNVKVVDSNAPEVYTRFGESALFSFECDGKVMNGDSSSYKP